MPYRKIIDTMMSWLLFNWKTFSCSPRRSRDSTLMRLPAASNVAARAKSALAAPFAEFDGVAFYEGLALRAAILCSRLLRNHPLPDGNKRVAYLCMIELVQRNGHEWKPIAPAHERAVMVERLASRDLDERAFATWVAAQIV
jgi:death on curing protein